MSVEMMSEINAALDQAELAEAIVILRGRPGMFSAGFDLRVFGQGEEALRILVEMGASPDQIRALFKNDAINLTLLTLMIQILQEMVGVEGRIDVVDQLILLETEAEAVFFAESLLMADWYKDNESPLAEMLPGTLVPVVLTMDGKVIAFTAADYAYWTPKQASIAAEFTQLYKEYSAQREAWIADQASPRFVEGIGALGWTVRSDMRASVLPEIPWGLSDDQE